MEKSDSEGNTEIARANELARGRYAAKKRKPLQKQGMFCLIFLPTF